MNSEEILESLKTLKYKDDSITLRDVYPSLLESVLNLPNGFDVESAGRDLDYGAETNGYEFSGSAYYGYCHVTKISGPERPKEEKADENENVYTRTSFYRDGRLIKDVPSVVKCNKELRDELLKNGTLKLFYICLGSSYCEMIPFYVKNEWDARLRALSIWGRYDDIKTAEEVEEIKLKMGKDFDRSYSISKNYYVLDWN